MKIQGLPIVFADDVHIPDLAGFHDHILDTAVSIVESGKEQAAPVIFILSNDGKLAIIPAGPFPKEVIAAFQKAVVGEPMVRACAMVFEAWVSSHPKEVDRKSVCMPSEDPNRGEAIIVSIMTAGRQAMTISHIQRPANTVQRAAFEWLDESGGEFSGRFVR
jgi:hypothetical protein